MSHGVEAPERSELHYLTDPEREWRCAECQQMCHDDDRCDCCVPKVPAEELRDLTDHIADFHTDNATLMAIVTEAYPAGPEAVVEAIREKWL